MTFAQWYASIGIKYLDHPAKISAEEKLKAALTHAWNASRSYLESDESEERNRGGGIKLDDVRAQPSIEGRFIAAFSAFNQTYAELEARLICAAIIAAGYDPLPNRGAEWTRHIAIDELRESWVVKKLVKIDGKLFGEILYGLDPFLFPGNLRPQLGVWTKLASEKPCRV
jgi:hypothetical protein